MLDDSDKWPITCPKCNQVTQEEIGRLKHGVRVTCDVCGVHLWYHVETFLEALDEARRAPSRVKWRIGEADKDS